MRQSLRMAAALLLALPAVAPAQRPVIDEGTLLVSRNGARAGRESFRIQAAENGRFLTATGQSVLGDVRITPALSVDSATGTPMLYRVEARTGGSSERLQATGRPGRLSAAFHRAGGESAKEYVLSGHVVVLDEDLYHQYALLPLLGWTGRVTVIVPRQGSQQAGTLSDRGSSTVRVDGKDVAARHLVLEVDGGPRDIWVDSQGRLLRVAIRSLGVDAVREEVPR